MLDQYLGDFYAIMTAISWSFAVIFFKWSSDHLPTIPLKIVQNLLASALFLLSLVLLGEDLLVAFTGQEWLLLVLSALIGITAGDTLYVAAIRRLGAGPQALVDGLYSPFVIVMAFFFFDERLSLQIFFGAALILVAIFLAHLDFRQIQITRRNLVLGFTYAILSQLAMAACVVMVRDILYNYSVLTVTAYRFCIGSLFLVALYSRKLNRETMWSGFTQRSSWRFTIPGTILGPYAATLFWFAGFKHTLAGKAAIYNQLSTLFIVVLAAIFLKEPLTKNRILAVLLAIFGGFIVLSSN